MDPEAANGAPPPDKRPASRDSSRCLAAEQDHCNPRGAQGAAVPAPRQRQVDCGRGWPRRAAAGAAPLRATGTRLQLDNGYRTYNARLIMLRESDVAGLFETRRSDADVWATNLRSAA
jgi:hypothetical protein